MDIKFMVLVNGKVGSIWFDGFCVFFFEDEVFECLVVFLLDVFEVVLLLVFEFKDLFLLFFLWFSEGFVKLDWLIFCIDEIVDECVEVFGGWVGNECLNCDWF